MPKKKLASKKRRVVKKKKFLLFNSRGNIAFTAILGVVIVGSVLLVSGIFPIGQITPRDPNAPKYRVDPNKRNQTNSSLHLRTIDFQRCSQTVAIEMVLDRSGSMRGQKIVDLKTASLFFISKLTDDAPFGLITYSDTITEEYPIQPFGQVKSTVQSKVQSLNANGYTHTRDALLRAKAALEIGIPQFPSRQFSLIFVSDGVPETSAGQFPPEQNPVTPPNVGDEIKNLNVKVYAIAITQGMNPTIRQQMTSLLQGLSSPGGFFEAPNTSDLQGIYDKIGFEMCQKAGGST